MAEAGEYPKAAYKLGGNVDVWGRMMFVRSLTDKSDEDRALADGWALHPLDLSDDDAPVKRGPGRPKKVDG